MHIRDINVDSEWSIICHWTVGLIKINTFNIITPIWTVVCNNFTFIITVAFLNTCSNEWIEEFCKFREIFDWDGSQNKADICFLSYWKIKIISIIVSDNHLNLHQCYLVWEVYLVDLIQYVKPQVSLDQICNEYLRYQLYGSSYFCID